MNEEMISKQELIDYIYYSENGKLIANLNSEAIKKFLKVDELEFEEYEHR